MGIITSDHTKRWPGGCMLWKFHEATSPEEEAAFRAAHDELAVDDLPAKLPFMRGFG
jgi:hypothetical protein